MWLILAFMSAALLGCYDSFKKQALKANAVIPVLFLNTLFMTLIFLPYILMSLPDWTWAEHKYIVLKALIVLSSWILGYFGMKHLPLTIVGPINATRPVMVLVGALLVFGERLNVWQWIGVSIAILSFYLMSRSGKKEGVDFKHNKWIVFVMLANVFGALSGLYDRYLLSPDGVGLDKMAVQSWFNIYQVGMMLLVLIFLWYPNRKKSTPYHWSWCIPLISIALSIADFVYFYALSQEDAMISIVSMIRRGSVIVSFLFGALMFKEKNLKAKAFDLLLVLLSMLFLFLGSK